MNRRNFLGSLVGGLATAAAVRTWPFRVYSFPSFTRDPLVIQPIEFVRAFDPLKWPTRFDVAYGFGNLSDDTSVSLNSYEKGILGKAVLFVDREVRLPSYAELRERIESQLLAEVSQQHAVPQV